MQKVPDPRNHLQILVVYYETVNISNKKLLTEFLFD